MAANTTLTVESSDPVAAVHDGLPQLPGDMVWLLLDAVGLHRLAGVRAPPLRV